LLLGQGLNGKSLKALKGKTARAARRVYLSGKTKKILENRLNQFSGENCFSQNEADSERSAASLIKLPHVFRYAEH